MHYVMLCAESDLPVKRSGGGRRVGSGSGSLGGGREEILLMSVWRSLDWMLSCCCCFEGVENGRLILSCLFADDLVSWWTWVGGDEGGRREPILRACGFPWNRLRPLLAVRRQGVEKCRRVLQLGCPFADTLVSRWRWVGCGGGVVSSLVAKSSTTIKDVWGYIVIRVMWLCVVVGRKGCWRLRVGERP